MRWSLLVMVWLIGVTLQAQEVRFYASTDTDKIFLGSTVAVTFTIENSNQGNFSPPSFSYAKQIGGVSQSSRQSYVNGVVSRSKSYTYQLQPNRPGTFTIPPAQYKVGRNVYETKPLKVQVVEPDDRQVDNVNGEDLFVRLEVTDTSLYIGQQAVLEYVLYHRLSVNNFQLENESDYEGFFVQEAQYRSSRSKREIINGKEYYRNVLKRLYLFPQRQGKYDLGPVEVTLGIIDQKRRRSFPFSRPSRYQGVVSNEVSIEVTRLPSDIASKVNGAVGSFKIGATIDSFRLTTDDAVTLTLELRGNGDKRNITAPHLNLGRDWEVYPPSLLTESEDARGAEITMYQRYQYLLVPQRKGTLRIDPKIQYLDATKDTIVTAEMARPFTVQVREGQRSVTIDDRSVGGAYQLSDRLPTGTPRRYRDTHFGSLLHHGLLGLGLLSMGLLLGVKRRRDIEAGIDPAIKRRKAAASLAQRHLKQAADLAEGQSSKYYEVLSKSLYGYVSDKYDIAVGALTMEEVLQRLRDNHAVELTHIESLRKIFLSCQQGLYAGRSEADRKELYDQAHQLIMALES